MMRNTNEVYGEYSTLNEEQQQAIVEEIAIEEFEKV
ncbi:hypothetical protein ABH968_002134 [Lysinibacillus sp. RC79]